MSAREWRPALVMGVCGWLLLPAARAARAQCDHTLALAAGPAPVEVITLTSDLSAPLSASRFTVGDQIPVGVRGTLLNVPSSSTEQLFVRKPDGRLVPGPMGAVSLNNPQPFLQDQFAFIEFFDLTEPGTWSVRLQVNGRTLVDLPFQVVGPASDPDELPGSGGSVPGDEPPVGPGWLSREAFTFRGGLRSADRRNPVAFMLFVNGEPVTGTVQAAYLSAGDLARIFQTALALYGFRTWITGNATVVVAAPADTFYDFAVINGTPEDGGSWVQVTPELPP